MTAEETAAAAATDAPEEVAEEAPPPGLPMRSFSGWVSGLKAYKWGAISFTVGIISGWCAVERLHLAGWRVTS